MGGKLKSLLAALIVPALFFIYGVFTLPDYGINWDEPYHFRRGQAFLQYFLTGKKTYEGMPKYPPLKGTADSGNFRNSQALFEEVQKNPSFSDPNFRRSYYQDDAWNGEYHIDMETPSGHPALNGILAAFFNKVFYQKLGILGDLESYHLFEITLSSVLVLAVAIFMLKEFGIIESVASSLALAAYPLFLGESHFNIKDPAETAFYTLTLLAVFKAVTKKSPLWLLASASSFAFALSIKFNVLFIIFPLAIWALVYFIRDRKRLRFSPKFYLTTVLSPLIIVFLFILLFPPLWKNPIQGILGIAGFYSKIGYSPPEAAAFNFTPLLWTFYTTPIVTLLLSATVFLFPKKLLTHKAFPFLLVLVLLTTILRVTIPGVTNYGGVRQIMEYVPAMAMLAGIGAGWITEKLKVKRNLALVLLLVLYSLLLFSLYRLHPHENLYFNSLIGGLSGAKEKGLDSWGNSYGNGYFPAIDWLNKNAEENARLTLPVGSISNIPRFKLRKDIALSPDYWSGPAHGGEYVLELTYDYEPMEWFSLKYLNTATKPVYEVVVDGVAIAKLWKNSPEYVLPAYQKEKLTAAKITKTDEYLELALPKEEKIMAVNLTLPTEGCRPIVTGYLETSVDVENWTREVEDIARDQLKQARLRELEENYLFYLVGTPAKYLRFRPENSGACILKATRATVTFLED